MDVFDFMPYLYIFYSVWNQSSFQWPFAATAGRNLKTVIG